MTCEEFENASLTSLAALTDVDKHRWSRYLSGKVALTDTTLSKIAPKLGMTPIQLLEAIMRRREKNGCAISQPQAVALLHNI